MYSVYLRVHTRSQRKMMRAKQQHQTTTMFLLPSSRRYDTNRLEKADVRMYAIIERKRKTEKINKNNNEVDECGTKMQRIVLTFFA